MAKKKKPLLPLRLPRLPPRLLLLLLTLPLRLPLPPMLPLRLPLLPTLPLRLPLPPSNLGEATKKAGLVPAFFISIAIQPERSQASIRLTASRKRGNSAV